MVGEDRPTEEGSRGSPASASSLDAGPRRHRLRTGGRHQLRARSVSGDGGGHRARRVAAADVGSPGRDVGRGAAGKVPVFGILERNGKVLVTVVANVSAETLIKLTVKTVRRGSIVYTDKFRSYDSLMFCGYRHLKIDHGKRFTTGKVYINGLEGFWSWAKERLIKHHGVSKQKFPLYLKELEFRYNNRHTDIFEKVSDFMCDLVPKPN